jgi:nicotinamide-nucleotide amidase
VSDYLLPDALVNKAREVVEANRSAQRRIAIAESCTGGLVSAALTEIAGSSDVFEAGYVTYSNAAKISELKVSEDVVDTFGAVSVATAWAMARGALAASDADVAVAITGIAGPGGGTPQKPVGTVVFARAERGADPAKIVADQKFFDEKTRSGVRLQAALCALDLLMPESAAARCSKALIMRLRARSNIAPASVSNSRDLNAKSTEKWTFVPPSAALSNPHSLWRYLSGPST